MLKKVEGIIISETNFGETSKIINLLTDDGIIGIMAKGAKSIKSPLRSYTLSLTYGEFNIYYHEDKLSTLKSADVIDEFKNIKKDITLISYMTYLCDLASQVMKQNQNEEIYNLLISALKKIDMGLNPMIMTNIYEFGSAIIQGTENEQVIFIKTMFDNYKELDEVRYVIKDGEFETDMFDEIVILRTAFLHDNEAIWEFLNDFFV